VLVADRGGGGDLARAAGGAVVAARAELRVVAELVGAEFVGAELHEVARQAVADARLEAGGAAKRSAASATSPKEHDTRR
jgi:hypothetical protein